LTDSAELPRRLPVGAEALSGGGVHFRVWAPRRNKVEVRVERSSGEAGPALFQLKREGQGYYSGVVREAAAGTRYKYRLDGGEAYPDPASRFQPDGPHGPSEVISPESFRWSDSGWQGFSIDGQVIYEMHVGTFTREGTWTGAARELPELVSLGVTVIEMMPIADFPGRFGWGYDGVDLYAPTRLYGRPDDLRRFIDRAHALGISVILDVVYNHLGPDGNYLAQYSESYFTDRYVTDWGDAINFEGEAAAGVRELFTANAGYWIDEYHFDGLRLDATQNIYDKSEDHILAAITREARRAARGRATIIVAENEPQHTRLVRPVEQGGYGMDALWNDDFHHSARVALTGRNEAYYTDYLGSPQELISAIKWGYLYQGQFYKWQKMRRGTPAFGLKPASFVTFIQNHDQVSNVALGERPHKLTSPGRYRAMTALVLLAPGTPMLFQGQEFAASSPFFFFADHEPELAKLVYEGRKIFLDQFPSSVTPDMRARIPDPADPETFNRSKLDLSERERNREAYEMHRDLLKLRRSEAAFRAQRTGSFDGAVIGAEALVLRFFGEGGDDRLLVLNLGHDLHLAPAPEPLLAPIEGKRWEILWSSENPRYGGHGTPPPEVKGEWRIPGHAAVVLKPAERAPNGDENGEEKDDRSDSNS
jgi:maltooligosyltrehalose trehalohydrolase